ncbi:mitochondrial import receptor subunit TOM40-1 [Tripterygium wilfordii]|uniref:Mitochondrial import receptor subunit TOM40-1 n=1 Tax=Tripterygium wilfordii TaxID=458696 RepID=A0A7J7DTZ4_TRIWF|nr:mitochondrial import receptor subunit TOM40-1 [Tripterygium wilfordii]
MVALSYVQKVSEKVSLATDFMYNLPSRDVTASAGYDYILRRSRLRGKIDSTGCVAAYLEERLDMGLNFILSAELSQDLVINYGSMILEFSVFFFQYHLKDFASVVVDPTGV